MGFVDVHSHVVPSGDDGAGTVREAVELAFSAAAHGTMSPTLSSAAIPCSQARVAMQ